MTLSDHDRIRISTSIAHDFGILAGAKHVEGDDSWTALSSLCPVDTPEVADAYREEVKLPVAYRTLRTNIATGLRRIAPGLIRSEEELRLAFHTIEINKVWYLFAALQRESCSPLPEPAAS